MVNSSTAMSGSFCSVGDVSLRRGILNIMSHKFITLLYFSNGLERNTISCVALHGLLGKIDYVRKRVYIFKFMKLMCKSNELSQFSNLHIVVSHLCQTSQLKNPTGKWKRNFK